MDKVEFKLRLEEIEKLIDNEKYPEAEKLADTIDWRRVKNVPLLVKVAKVYRMDKRFEDSRDVLLIAYDRNPSNKNVLYNLCEIYADYNDIEDFMDACKEYLSLAGKDDIGVYTLKYTLFEMQDVGIEERIQLLEELKRKERIEKWEYELAYLYHRAGFGTKCVEECDELILWFGEGSYVTKAMELKMLHSPLTPEQQEKYNHRNDMKFQEAIQAGSSKPVNDLDFRVHTVDLNNKFSTMNLQIELAKDIQPYLDKTDEIKPVNVPAQDGAAPETKRVSRGSRTVYHETIPADAKEVFFEDQTSDMRYQVPVPENAGSLNNPEMQAFREEFARGYAGKEPAVSYGRLYDPAENSRDIQEISMEEEEVKPAEKTSSALDPYLSQGSDGQISMAVFPEEKIVEKQITGQMNIDEVIKDWEKIKKQNTQKREDDIRKKMLAQTGEIFRRYENGNTDDELLRALKEFDSDKPLPKATKVVDASLGAVPKDEELTEEEKETMAELEAAVSGSAAEFETGIKEATETEIEAEDAAEGTLEEITAPDDMEEVGLSEEPQTEETTEGLEDENQRGEFYGSVTGLIPGSIWKEVDELQAAADAQAASMEAEGASVEAMAEVAGEAAISEEGGMAAGGSIPEGNTGMDGTQILENEVEKALSEDQEKDFNVEEGDSVTADEVPVTDNTADIPLTIRDDDKEETAKTQLSREVKELFSPFLYSKRMKKQIVAALEKMSLAAYTSNIVISSDQEESGRNLATTFIKYMKQTEGNFSGQVAKVKAERLNQIDVTEAFNKVTNGAMIIENANTLSSQTLTKILQTLNQEEKGYQVILVDQKNEVRKLMARSPYMKEFFNCEVEIIAMSTNMLVEFGEKYAFEQGYAIDSMGILALNKRIDVLQVGMHVVTMGEVKEIVDEAIENAEKSKVGRSLTRKRKNEEGMVLLLEKDFED